MDATTNPTASAADVENDYYMANYSTPGSGHNGFVTVEDFLNELLELPLDHEYLITMQDSKSFPTAVEQRHELLVRGRIRGLDSKEILRSSLTSRKSFELDQSHELKGRKLELSAYGTVRSLIHGLMAMGLSSDDLLTIGGHFYSGFYFKAYPSKEAFAALKAKQQAEFARIAASVEAEVDALARRASAQLELSRTEAPAAEKATTEAPAAPRGFFGRLSDLIAGR